MHSSVSCSGASHAGLFSKQIFIFFVHMLNLYFPLYLSLMNQDEGLVLGTTWGDGCVPSGLPDIDCVRGEPVHQGAAGTRDTHKNTTLDFLLSSKYQYSLE